MSANKRRKPKQERSKEKVDQIIRASARIIDREGYHAFSTNRVAKDAGVGIATIYEYFANKEEILLAVLEHELAGISMRIEAKIPEILRMEFEPACRELFRFILSEVTAKAEFMRVIAGQLHGSTDFEPAIRFFAQSETVIRMLLATFSTDRDQDLRLDAFLTTHAFAGICTGIATGLPLGQDLDSVVDRLVDIAQHLVGREPVG